MPTRFMPLRAARRVSAGFAVIVAAVALTGPASLAQTAGKTCLAAPKSVTPAGKHWYYRWDRVNKRKCWYLGQQGQPTRSDPTKASAPEPVPVPPARPEIETAAQPPSPDIRAQSDASEGRGPNDAAAPVPAQEEVTRPPGVASPSVASPVASPMDAIRAGHNAIPNSGVSSPAMPVPAMPNSAAGPTIAVAEPGSPGGTPTPTDPQSGGADPTIAAGSPSSADANAAAEPQGDMPLVWPVLSQADIAAEAAPPARPADSWFAFSQEQMLLLIAAILGIAALVSYAIAKLFGAPSEQAGRADRFATVRGPVIQDNRLPLGLGEPRIVPRVPAAAGIQPARRDRIPAADSAASRPRWQRKSA